MVPEHDYHRLAIDFAEWRAKHSLSFRDCESMTSLSKTTFRNVERIVMPTLHRTTYDVISNLMKELP